VPQELSDTTQVDILFEYTAWYPAFGTLVAFVRLLGCLAACATAAPNATTWCRLFLFRGVRDFFAPFFASIA
jgi:hypothetical protein